MCKILVATLHWTINRLCKTYIPRVYYLCMHIRTVAQVHFQYHVRIVFIIDVCGSLLFICSDLKCQKHNCLQCLPINNFRCIRPLAKIISHKHVKYSYNLIWATYGIKCITANGLMIIYVEANCVYVTRFAKTRHNDAFLETQIFASSSSIYLKLCSVAMPMLYCKYFSSYKAR